MANSLQAIINVFQEFYENTGLKTNYEKSVIYRTGSLKNTQRKLTTSQHFKWSNEAISFLGVCCTADDLMNQNFDSTLKKTEAILKLWHVRDLSLPGKVNVVNTLAASLYMYKMQVLPNMTDNIISKFKSLR